PRPGRAVVPDVAAERDPAGGRSRQAGDGAEHRALAGAGRPDERDRPLDRERQLDVEGAERNPEVCSESVSVHEVASLRAMRRAALMRTRRPLIASATSKSTVNWL